MSLPGAAFSRCDLLASFSWVADLLIWLAMKRVAMLRAWFSSMDLAHVVEATARHMINNSVLIFFITLRKGDCLNKYDNLGANIQIKKTTTCNVVAFFMILTGNDSFTVSCLEAAV